MIDVAVIGLGRIGSSYDYGCQNNVTARSHVGTIVSTPGLRLVAAIDPDAQARDAARGHWRFGDEVILEELVDAVPKNVDVAVICTPSDERLAVVESLLAKGVSLLVIEKPLALSLAQAEEIVSMVSASAVELRVNFHRRFDPRLESLRHSVSRELPHHVIMRYGNGLYNYGSHVVDLILNWFGRVFEVQAIGEERGDSDPCLSFRCGLDTGVEVTVIGLNGLKYDQFEIEMYWPDRKLELVAGGVIPQWQYAEENRFYTGYTHLGAPEQLAEPKVVSGLSELWTRISEGNFPQLPGCDAADGLEGMRIIEAARLSYLKGGVVIPKEKAG